MITSMLMVLFVTLVTICSGLPLPQSARDIILQQHNYVRDNVSPNANPPLTQFVYDVSIENEVSGFVDACNLQHTFISGHGQNIYAGSATGVSVDTLMYYAVGNWESEKNDYNIYSNSCTSGKECGHYTQLVWHQTTSIGCAYAVCNQPTPRWPYSLPFHAVYCDYVTGGNNNSGNPPYTPCSNPPCGGISPSPSPVPPAASQSSTRTPSLSPSLTPLPSNSPAPSCNNPCAENYQCSWAQNSCGSWVHCGDCASGVICESNYPAVGTTCVADPPCDPYYYCSAYGYQCGNAYFCDMNIVCGSCGSGQICSGNTCINDPCNSCPTNSYCSNSECICNYGYILENGQCVAPTVTTLDFYSNFYQTIPYPYQDYSVIDDYLYLTYWDPTFIRWEPTLNVVDKYQTTVTVIATVDIATFGISMRYGGDPSNPNANFYWEFYDVGYGGGYVRMCQYLPQYSSTAYCGYGSYIPFYRGYPNVVTMTMGFDDYYYSILTSISVNYNTPISTNIWAGYYPELGRVAFYFNADYFTYTMPSLTGITMATSATLTVSLTDCIDDAEWANMFYYLTGANPSTTSVQIRGLGENGRCSKAIGTEKQLVSGFTFIVSSTSVSAGSLASTFTNMVGTPAGAGIGIVSASIIPGSIGAASAGFINDASTLPGVYVKPPVGPGNGQGALGTVGGATGGGGSGGGDISGGAIAGIVVGSVAGAILLVGIALLILVLIVVALVVLASSGEDDVASPPSERRRRSTVVQNIRSFFGGGVDVMNGGSNAGGHTSITARAPPQ